MDLTRGDLFLLDKRGSEFGVLRRCNIIYTKVSESIDGIRVALQTSPVIAGESEP